MQEHGFVDLIVHRQEMRSTLSRILKLLWPQPAENRNGTADAATSVKDLGETTPTTKNGDV